MDLKELVGQLTIERVALSAWVEETCENERKMRTTPEGLACERSLEKMREAEARVNETELQVRMGAIGVFLATGNKKPAAGIGIREGEVFEYDDRKALAWCIKHHHTALRLDRREFAKAARIMRPKFFNSERKVTATIARDLPAAIAKAAKEAQDEAS